MNRLPDKANKQNYNFYCILLADVWNYRNKRKNETKRIDIGWEKIVKDYTDIKTGAIILVCGIVLFIISAVCKALFSVIKWKGIILAKGRYHGF